MARKKPYITEGLVLDFNASTGANSPAHGSVKNLTENVLEFDGADDYIVLNHSVELSGDFSICFDINYKGYTDYDTVLSDGTTANALKFYAEEKLRLRFDGTYYLTSSLLDLNKWVNVVVTRVDNNLQIYFDGENATAISGSTASPLNLNHIMGESSRRYVNGGLCNLTFWNKALTQSEIKYYMNNRPTREEKSLIGYWKLNEGEGTIVYDYSPYHNHGTMYNFSTTAWKNNQDLTLNNFAYTTGSGFEKETVETNEYELAFDGVDDYAVVNYNPIFNVSEITIMAKVKIPEIPPYYARILDRSRGSSYCYGIQQTGEPLFTFSGIVPPTANTVLPINKYVDIAVSYGNGQLTYYLDGEIDGQFSYSIGLGQPTNDIYIGRLYDNIKHLFKGIAKNLSVFSKVLTQQEIQQYMKQPPVGNEEGLVGYWKLNEGQGTTVLDYSPYRNHGTMYNFPADCWKPKQALQFDGVDDYVGKTTVEGDSLDIENELTIEADFRFNDNSTYQYLVSKNIDGMYADQQYAIAIAFDTIVAPINGNVQGCTYNFSENENYKICLTWDGSIVKVYVNGVEVLSYSHTAPLSFKPNFSIGGRADVGGSAEFFAGIMNYVCIWNKALTQSEIQEYEKNPPTNTETNLVGYWKLNEAQGTTAYDYSGNNNDAIMYNFPTDPWVDRMFAKELHSVEFDGVDDIVSFDDNLRPSEFSLEAIVNIPNFVVDGSYNRAIIGINDTDYSVLLTTWTNGSLLGCVKNTTLQIQQLSSRYMSTNTYNHVVMTFNGSIIKIFINGVEGQIDSSDYRTSATNTWEIARRTTTYGHLLGKLLYCRIYNKALTPEEVLHNYVNRFEPVEIEATREEEAFTQALTSDVENTAVATREVNTWSLPIFSEIYKTYDLVSDVLGEDYSKSYVTENLALDFNASTGANNPAHNSVKNFTKNVLRFDGIDDVIICGDEYPSGVGEESFTIALWLHPDKIKSDIDFYVPIFLYAGGSISSNLKGFYLRFYPKEHTGTINNIACIINDTIINDTVHSSIPFNEGEWTHYAVVINRATGYITPYINGKPDLNARMDISAYDSLLPEVDMYLGKLGGYPFKGNIKNVTIWDKPLTDTDIQNHMYGNIEQPPVRYYKLNEGEGTYIYDYSPYHNHGAMYNFPPDCWKGNQDLVLNNYAYTEDSGFGTEDVEVPEYELEFDGVDDYVSKITVEGDPLDIKDKLTIEVDFIIHDLTPEYQYLISKNLNMGYGDQQYSISIEPSDFVISVGGAYKSFSHSLQVNKKYSICFSWNGAEVIAYLDGNEVGRFSYSGTLPFKPNFSIGRRADGGSGEYFFDGIINHVRIWNKALTQSEIYQYMQNPPKGNEPGLVGYWKLNEGVQNSINKVIDYSPYKNHGIMNNFATDCWKTKKALTFDGVDDYINFTGIASYIDDKYSFECWIYKSIDGVYDPNYGQVISASAGGSGYPLWVSLMDDGRLRIWSYVDLPGDVYATDPGIIKLNKLYHIIVTAYKNNTCKLYINGKKISEFTAGNAVDFSNYLTLGDLRPDRGLNFEGGYISGVRLYNDVLTPEQVKNRYEYKEIDNTGLVIDSPINEGQGTTVYDYSVNNNNGTMYNFPTNPWIDRMFKKSISKITPDAVDDSIIADQNVLLQVPYAVHGLFKLSSTAGNLADTRVLIKLSDNNYPQFSPSWYDIKKPLIYLNSNNYKYGNADLRDDKWHTITFLVSGNIQDNLNNIRIFIDGKEDTYSTTITSDPPYHPDGNTLIGIRDFEGTIAYVRAYDNKELMPEEILQNYVTRFDSVATEGEREESNYTLPVSSETENTATSTREATSYLKSIVADIFNTAIGERIKRAYFKLINSDIYNEAFGTREESTYTDKINSKTENVATALRVIRTFTKPFNTVASNVATVIRTAGSYMSRIISTTSNIAAVTRTARTWFKKIMSRVINPKIWMEISIQNRNVELAIQERIIKLEVENVPFTQNTVKLKATFTAWGGTVVDPTDVTLKIYNSYRELIETITDLVRTEAGKYEYDYELPDTEQTYVYEFSGMAEGSQITARGTVDGKFV